MKITTAVLCLICSFTFGQKISNIDFDTIKTKITNSKSAYYFPKLIKRFEKADSTLTAEEFACIYYGNIFSDNYNPYGAGDDNEEKFYELYGDGKYKEAILYGKKVLKKNPVNLKMSFKMLVCYDATGDKKTAEHYAAMYFPLLNVIFDSGDGKSVETAYVVINVSDEYEILADLGLNRTMQTLSGETDILTISTENQTQDPKITLLYFNVNKPLDYLHQQFSGAKK